MSEIIITVLSAIIGAILGGIFSLLGSYFASKAENKRLEMEYKNQINIHNIEKKETFYLALVEKIADCKKIEVEYEPMQEIEENLISTLSNDKQEKTLNELAEFLDKNTGMSELYLPSQVSKEILNLRSQLYSLSQKELNFMSKETLHMLQDMIFCAERIIILIRHDLGIFEKANEKIEFKSNLKED